MPTKAEQEFLTDLEVKYDLPDGLLTSIRKLESGSSNNPNLTSSAGAKGAFQFMPSAAKRFGVDTTSFSSSAIGAARYMDVLLSKYGGDVSKAVAAYNWGEGHVDRLGLDSPDMPDETHKYVKIVNKSLDDRELSFMLSKFDRGEVDALTIQKGLNNYEAKGYKIDPKWDVIVNKADADAFSTRFNGFVGQVAAGDRSVADKLHETKARIASGDLVLKPEELSNLNAAIAKYNGQQTGVDWSPEGLKAGWMQGVRDVNTGLAGLVDIPLNAAASVANLVSQGVQGKDVVDYNNAQKAMEAYVSGKNDPNSNPLLNTAIVGATQALVTAPIMAANAATQAVVQGVPLALRTGTSLALELATGAGANVGGQKGAELGRQYGGQGWVGDVGALGGGFIGALGGALTAAGATNVARAAGKAVIEAAPEAIVAATHPVQTGKQLASAVSQKIAGTEPFSQARQVATIDEVVANVPHREVFKSYTPAQYKQAVESKTPLPIQELTDAGERLVKVTGLDVKDLDTAFKKKFYAELPPKDRAIGLDAPTAESLYPLPAKPSPLARAFGAEATGIPLTAGEVIMNPKLQGAEANLRAAATLPGEQGRALAFKESQKEGIVQAVNDLYKSIDVPIQAVRPEATLATKVGRGEAIREGLSTELAKAQSDTKKLYEVAKASDVEIPLDTPKMKSELSKELNGILNDEYIPETSRRAVIQRMAKYDLIGAASPTVDSTGYTTVTLGDGVTKVKISGRPEPLTLNNADEFRKSLNDMYDYTDPYLNKRVGDLKRVFDNKLDEAVNNATIFGTAGKEKVIAFEIARTAFKKSKATWDAKDLLQSLVSNKKGTNTPLVIAEDIGRKVLGADEKNFEAIMDILKNPSGVEARVAYNAVQMEAISSLFDKAAMVDNAGNLVSISGAKLKSAVERLPAGRLEEVLSPIGDRSNLFGQRLGVSGVYTNLYKDFKKLQMLIGDATVPLADTQNPSGTAYKLMSGLGTMMASGVGALTSGPLGAFGGMAAKHAYDFMKAKRLLETMYSPEKIMKLAAEATVPKEMANFRTAFDNLMSTASQVKHATPVILTAALATKNATQLSQQLQQNKKK